MKARIKSLVADICRNRPLCVGLILAALLFGLALTRVLNSWSANAESFQFDHHALTRCGMAIRYGTNIYKADVDYRWFGYHSSDWTSLPWLCVLGGVPLSYLPPNFGYYLMCLIYFLTHIAILIYFGLRLLRQGGHWRPLDYVAFAGFGFFFPWYIIYQTGQFHALAVAGLALVLVNERAIFWGFLLSALGKPILAAGVVSLIAAKRWKIVLRLSVICLALYLPWLLLDYSPKEGLHFGQNRNWTLFYGNASTVSTYSVFRWNQEMSWAKVFDELFPVAINIFLRKMMGGAILILSGVLAWRGKLKEALCISTLFYLTYYARGHEYHLTLYVPLYLYLYTRPDGAYRNRVTVALILLAACPTVFPIFKWLYAIPDKVPSSDQMLLANPFLYGIWLVQKPILSMLTAGLIGWRELKLSRTS